MLLGLHSFGHGFQPQLLCQASDGAYGGQVGGRTIETMDEGAIDFEGVERQLLKVVEGRVAGAKVVDGNANPQITQLLQFGGGSSQV